MSQYLMNVAEEKDEQQFVDILNRNLYMNGDADERNEWFYTDTNSERYLMFDSEVDDPIGSIGFNIRPFKTPLGVKMGAIAADLSVDKSHRNVQTAITLINDSVTTMLAKSGVDFVYTIPNKKAKLVVKRTRLFKSVGIFHRHIKLISFREVLDGTKYKFVIPIIDMMWKTYSNITNFMLAKGVVSVDDNFLMADDVWYTYNNDLTSMGMRNQKYLSWRYFKTPDKRFKTFHVSYKGDDAYLVYIVIKNRAYVIDLLYPKDNFKMLITLFANFEMYSHYMNFSLIEFQHLGSDSTMSALEKMWYKKYTNIEKELLVASNDNNLLNSLIQDNKS